MKKYAMILVACVIALLFLGTAIFLYRKSQQDPVVYEVEKPYITDIIKKTVATGKVVPRKEVSIKSQVSGVVDKIYVVPGQKVDNDDLIAKIRLIPDMEHLNAAESQLDTAKINFRNAKRELDRQQKLYEDGLVSKVEYNRLLLDYELQEEAVEAAENNVALIKEGASKKSGQVSNLVKATTAGMVLDVPVKEGTFVIETNTFNEGTTIAEIANMTDMIFEGTVDESEVGKIREGMELVLNVGAIDNESFTAVLEYIAPKGIDDQGTIKFEIRAAVNIQTDIFLRAGYSATADIVLDKRTDVLAVNEGNLIFENEGVYVEVEVSEQKFEKRQIETGLSDGINIEVIGGIEQTDKIKRL
ncbi:MAG: efflux RND transporter periplasmic adaptor subunit [Gammaproteobacteria bacterium]|nr:efflux RND transporter periplasmic adaptor subunit [Gammaproteobacteria bacterium]